MSYVAMVFYSDPITALSNVRALRSKPYPSQLQAQRAIEQSQKEDYIKRVGHPVPVWHNVQRRVA